MDGERESFCGKVVQKNPDASHRGELRDRVVGQDLVRLVDELVLDRLLLLLHLRSQGPMGGEVSCVPPRTEYMLY